ncbi:MAG: MFS transporter [Saprospiraceae bacterium]|jgi:predicted MFS family arabinose efflux permease|nr:MFS transporter [Saprospiraceae bacterium]
MTRKEILLLLVLATIQFLHIVDFMIIMPLGSQFMRVFEVSPQQFSLIVSAYAFSAFLAGLVSAMFIDRYDRKSALLVLNIGFTLGTLVCAIAPSYELLLAARAFTGAFGGTLGAVILATVSDVIPLERRATAMGYVMTSFSVASVAGVPTGIYLAATFSWQAPFLVIGALAFLTTFLIFFAVPALRRHLDGVGAHAHPLQAIGDVVRDRNQLTALAFTLILMLGHFSIIPFIAPYMQFNVGFSDHQIAYIYTLGGIVTVVLMPLFGRLSDRFGPARIFALASFFALFSIFAITNLPHVSLVLALCATSSFFAVASGRNVPAMTMATAVVRPERRGSFMSVRGSVNEMSLALASLVSGFIVVKNPDGSLGNYPYVGYLAIAMSILAIVVSRRLKVVEGA